jgi:starch-binding domain-containing protein 1
MLAAAATTSAAALRAPAVASRRAASSAARAAPRRTARCQAGPEAGPGHVEYGAPGASDAIATRSDLAAERNPSSMRRAREILAIDPTAENALDLVGTKVNMTCRFSVHYETKLGEDLFVIGSHEKLGAWRMEAATPMTWTEGGVWQGDVDLPAGGVFFYKYVVKQADGTHRWQDGANNLLALPEPWDVPNDSVFVVDDQFGGLTKEAQNQLAVKLIMTEKEKVGLKVQANKAKEMTKAALQELLLAREELREAHEKLAMYEQNADAVFSRAANDAKQR